MYSMYVAEHYGWPDNRLRRLSIRKHGFASLRAGATEGDLTTRPVVCDGPRLLLHYSTSAAGSVRVELQDARGRPIERFDIEMANDLFGDDLDGEAGWKGALSAPTGRTVRLRFVLRDADLFSFRFAD